MMSIPVPRIMTHASGSTVAFHQCEHFLHGVGQADKYRAAYDAMPDVEFNQVRDAQQNGQVLAVQCVSGVDPKAQQRRLLRSADETIQFFRASALEPNSFGERAGVQFDELAAGPRG